MSPRRRGLVFGLLLAVAGCQLIGGIGDRRIGDSPAGGGAGAGADADATGAADGETGTGESGAGGSDSCAKAVADASVDASSSTFLGSTAFVGDAKLALESVTRDATSGELTLIGGFVGTLDFGNCIPPLVSDANGDYFLARLDSQRHTLWARRLETIDQPATGKLASTTDGGFWLAGEIMGALQLGPGVTDSLQGNGVPKIFYARFDELGQVDIKNQDFTAYSSLLRDVFILPDDSIGLVGTFYGTLSFGGSSTEMVAASWSGFVAALAPDGLGMWAADAAGCPSGGFHSVVNNDEALLVSGEYTGGPCTLGPGVEFPTHSASECFVARYETALPAGASRSTSIPVPIPCSQPGRPVVPSSLLG